MHNNNNPLNFLKSMREMTIYRFSAKTPLAKALYDKLSQD
jgi:hypothetical protein